MAVKLAEIENALLAVIDAALTYLEVCEPVSSRNMGETGIIAPAPSVLALYTGAAAAANDVRGLSYVYDPRWVLLAYASNLRGALAEKQGDTAPTGIKGAYDLLDDLRTALGGKKLTFASGGGGLAVLGAEVLDSFSPEGTVYTLEVMVRTHFVNEE